MKIKNHKERTITITVHEEEQRKHWSDELYQSLLRNSMNLKRTNDVNHFECTKCGNERVYLASNFCDRCGIPVKQDKSRSPEANQPKYTHASGRGFRVRICPICSDLVFFTDLYCSTCGQMFICEPHKEGGVL